VSFIAIASHNILKQAFVLYLFLKEGFFLCASFISVFHLTALLLIPHHDINEAQEMLCISVVLLVFVLISGSGYCKILQSRLIL